MNTLALEPRERTATCGRCTSTFDPPAWAALRVVERLRYEQLRDLLSEWPWTRDTFLEVRECRCGATVSRLVVRR